MKSVNIGRLAVRPVPKEVLDKVSCTHCVVRAARWEIGEWNYACSTCFLYELPILKEQQTQVQWLIENVQKAVGYVFDCDEEGRVVGEGADRVVTGIVVTQRYEMMRGFR